MPSGDLDSIFDDAFGGTSRQLVAALDAASRGWHVFPCGADKAPLTPHGFKDATCDEAAVREFWREFPAASVGVATGASGLIVVDLDCKKGKPGLDEWHRLKGELGEEIEGTTLVETPSGGMHVYYRANGHKVQSTAERIAPGIDTRAEGGYVIAAGSPGYEYVEGHEPGRLREMPAGLYKIVLQAAPRAREEEPTGAPIPEGRRDSVLASLAGTMRRRGLSPDAIYAALAETNRTRCRPPLDDAQVRKIARSVGRYEPKVPLPEEAAQPAEDEVHESASPFLDWSTFWTEEDEPDWVYPDVLAWGRGHALYATHKAGKSLLSLFIAAEVATKSDCHALYVDYEMTERDVRERLSEMGYGPESDLSRLHYALLPKMPPLDTEPGGQALMDLLDLASAENQEAHFVVVIDTISRAVEGEENSADTWRFFYLYTGMRLKQRGVTWMRLDHAGKDAERGQRGSSGKGDDVDIVWKLQATQNGVVLKRELARMGWCPEKVTLLKRDSPVLHYIRASYDQPSGTLELVELLDSIGLPANATNKQVRDALRVHKYSASSEVVAASVRWRRAQPDGGTSAERPPLPAWNEPAE